MQRPRTIVISILRDQRGQDTFEYLLVVGAVVVPLVLALLAFEGLIPDFVGHSCESVDTAADPGATNGSCINESP